MVHMFFLRLFLLVLAVIYNAVKDVSEVSLNSVLNTLRGIRMTFIVNKCCQETGCKRW